MLCARGAARAGAGYVTVAAPDAAAPALRAHLIEQVVVTIDPAKPAQDAVADLLDVAKQTRRSPSVPASASTIVRARSCAVFAERCPLPMVVDASGLFHFAKHLEMLRGKPVVLTPHAGEFARLSGKGTVETGSASTAARVRRSHRHHDAAQRPRDADLRRCDHAPQHDRNEPRSRRPERGDVLTGIIATLLSQGSRRWTRRAPARTGTVSPANTPRTSARAARSLATSSTRLLLRCRTIPAKNRRCGRIFQDVPPAASNRASSGLAARRVRQSRRESIRAVSTSGSTARQSGSRSSPAPGKRTVLSASASFAPMSE